MNLSKVPTCQLLKELECREQRGESQEYVKIKQLAHKNNLKLAAQLLVDGYNEEMPYIMLGVLGKKKEFKDFYYSSGLEYEQIGQYIPSGFAEVTESTYEYHPNKKLTKEKYIKEAFDILTKCGYIRVEDFIE